MDFDDSSSPEDRLDRIAGEALAALHHAESGLRALLLQVAHQSEAEWSETVARQWAALTALRVEIRDQLTRWGLDLPD